MSQGLLFRLLLCIFIFGFSLYRYIDRQNDLTELKIEIPKLAREVKELNEKNYHLQYQIDQFERPSHLFELLKNEPYNDLNQPCIDEVILIKEGYHT